jgi:predicted kinase
MGRLVLINGVPGIGKSTLARRYAADHPLSLVLDVDQVRGMLGRWIETPSDAGVLARRLAIEMAGVHLRGGHDVVVPQFLGRTEFVLSLEELCRHVGAPFVEVALVTGPEEARRRFTKRSEESQRAEHRDAALLLDRSGGADEFRHMHERLMEVIATRPSTRRVTSVDGQVEQTYRDFLAAISEC